MKKFKIDLNKIKISNRNSNWQKGISGALLISLGIFFLALVYLLVRPLSKDVQNIIDTEISSIDVVFDNKTIDMVKKRQEPNQTTAPTVGKNPFIPF